jgi:hypothetical protein
MEKKQPKVSEFRQRFNENFGEFSDSEIQKEILMYQILENQKLDAIKSNTSKMVWFLIVIPIVIAVVAALS